MQAQADQAGEMSLITHRDQDHTRDPGHGRGQEGDLESVNHPTGGYLPSGKGQGRLLAPALEVLMGAPGRETGLFHRHRHRLPGVSLDHRRLLVSLLNILILLCLVFILI